MLGVIKRNETLKGVILGLLVFIILGFGTVAVIAGFETIRLWSVSVFIFTLLMVINFVIAGFLGIGIAYRLEFIKKLAYVLTIIAFLTIVSGYGYFIWYRLFYGV